MPDKTCFVIGPIGAEDSDARIHADWLLEFIISPVMQKFPDFHVERADKISQPGLIDAQIISRLLTAELCIADLSFTNPNAFYEIGIRHMAQKPIIHMHQAGDSIPFDVSLYRSIKFSRRTTNELKQACDDLERSVRAVLADDYVLENPVTNVRGRLKLEQSATPEEKVFIDRLTALEARVSRTEASAGLLSLPASAAIILDIHLIEEEVAQFGTLKINEMRKWLNGLFDNPAFYDLGRRYRIEMPNNDKNRAAVQRFRTLIPRVAGILSIDIYS